MFDSGLPEIGPPEPAVFVGVERDPGGRGCACFVTRDGESFALDASELELRIEWLRQQGLETSEERRGLQGLVAAC